MKKGIATSSTSSTITKEPSLRQRCINLTTLLESLRRDLRAAQYQIDGITGLVFADEQERLEKQQEIKDLLENPVNQGHPEGQD